MVRLGLGLIGALIAAPASATTPYVTVGSGSSADFTSLQAAIDAVEDGTTLVVIDQTPFEECLRIEGRTLRIYGSAHSDARSVLSCTFFDEPALVVRDSHLQISGFEIRHLEGRGVDVSDSELHMAGMHFEGLAAIDFGGSSGAAVFAVGSTVEIVDSNFLGNRSHAEGGAIASFGGTLRLTGSHFTENEGGFGGAVRVFDGNLVANNVTFHDNQSEADGGALRVDGAGATIELRDVTASGNTALQSGGFLSIGSGVASISQILRSTIEDGAAWSGGAIDAESPLLLVGVTVRGCIAIDDGGGAVRATSTLQVLAGRYTNNRAAVRGGAFLLIGNATLRDVQILDNEADLVGGGLQVTGSGELTMIGGRFEGGYAELHGGGAMISGKASFTGTQFIGNQATEGGGLWVASPDPLPIRGSFFLENQGDFGGAIFASADADISLIGSRLWRNQAEDGGAIFRILGPRDLVILRSEFYENQVWNQGGAIFAREPGDLVESRGGLSVQDTDFVGNQATSGGALHLRGVPLGLQRSRLAGNAAFTGDGGAIFTRQGRDHSVQLSVFCVNEAQGGGGAIAFESQGSSVEVLGSVFAANASFNLGGGALYLNSIQHPLGDFQFFFTGWNTFLANHSPWGGSFRAAGNYVNTSVELSHNLHVQEQLYALSSASTSNPIYASFNFYDLLEPEFSQDIPPENLTDNVGMFIPFPNLGSDCFAIDATSPEIDSAGAHNAMVALGNHLFRDHDRDGVTIAEGDCNDSDASIFPGADEIPYNGIDEDCFADDLIDVDMDGFVAEIVGGTDCDDDDPDTNLGADPTSHSGVDRTCGLYDPDDMDGDGFRAVAAGGDDCDDNDPTIYPGALEIAFDGIDQDCDGLDLDLDGDGFAARWVSGDGTVLQEPDGEADCDDSDPSINPGATEIPGDGIDQNCTGTELCFEDRDEDGWRTHETRRSAAGDLTCSGEGLALATLPDGDCDDDDPTIFPGAEEIPGDGIDQSCSGTELCFEDRDDDSYRTDEIQESSLGDIACAELGVALATVPDGDCDDDDPTINPGAEEIWYDGIDQNCDGLSDFDQDFDGHDSDRHPQPDGSLGDDCDDLNPLVNPSAPEILDGIDNNCDGQVDTDSDGDGVLDYYEVRQGTNPLQRDSDGDGIPDGVEWGSIDTHEAQLSPLDSDEDGVIDALDTDSDSDGLSDAFEAGPDPSSPRDTDGDGVPDYRDPDDDGDTLPTHIECPSGQLVDTDGDGAPNCLDLDSDGDGALDRAEGLEDNTGNGVPNYLDPGSNYEDRTTPRTPDDRGFGLGCSTAQASATGWGVVLWALIALARRRRELPKIAA
ncbi:MAG: hypothetical protein EA397_11625 [Deltaproteobacteria bacterium]|nr:MAG: hypothetical protein EA397_11625 [Deltaproteobacteria bacterium]